MPKTPRYDYNQIIPARSRTRLRPADRTKGRLMPIMPRAPCARWRGPERIPYRTLPTGAGWPLGWGRSVPTTTTPTPSRRVLTAAEVGYRHFDRAVYGNEPTSAPRWRPYRGLGGPRRDVHHLEAWNDSHGEEEVPPCRRSLDDLRLDALDMYLVHWPFPNHHPPGCDVDARNPRARPYVHAEYMRTWRQMERLVKMGLVRHIGTSNMTIPKLELLLRDAEIRPACNQMELHPHMQQPELFAFLLQQGIVPVGYSPVGSPNRPARDVTPADTVDTEDPVIRAIAERLGVHPAVVCIKWAEQRGQVPIPFSVKRNQQLASLKAVVAEPLNPADMEALAGIDRNCRLIKGQVFLWEGASGWEDLWDIDGAVAEG